MNNLTILRGKNYAMPYQLSQQQKRLMLSTL